MATSVWKYEWPLQPARAEKSFDMPFGADILYAREQRESICIWARVDAAATITERRDFVLCGTGHQAPAGYSKYVGSGHFHDGSLVLHVFEVGRSAIQ